MNQCGGVVRGQRQEQRNSTNLHSALQLLPTCVRVCKANKGKNLVYQSRLLGGQEKLSLNVCQCNQSTNLSSLVM